MKKTVQTLTFLILLLTPVSIGLAQAQEVEKVPVKLEIVLSRYDGNRKVSSLPLTLQGTANSGTNMTASAGKQLPVSTLGADAKPTMTFLNISTNIDCKVSTDSGKYRIEIRLEDSSAGDPPSNGAVPADLRNSGTTVPPISTFKYSTSVLLKEGETKQIVSMPDKFSSNVVKIDITLTLDK